ncbi:MAG: NAD(P)-dependent oxidoreductase [Bacteroidetes bacterium]|nr:NAD(P)-dependent oxidoreductase [Bacteroidota bacterium]
MKAFLGMGLLGSNFVKAMIKKNETVQVWNRTFSKAKELESFGAKVFENVAEAVRGADIIHLTLRDDDSVNDVLKNAQSGLKPGAIIIDHTTTTVAGAIERTGHWKKLGCTYQHAPVFMGPSNAFEGTGFMLISGDPEVVGKLENQLSAMTGKLINFGSETGRAAAMKLVGNCFLVGFTAALGDALTLAKTVNAPMDDVDKLFASWNPATSISARVKRITQDDLSKPSWELNMSRKDTSIFIKTAEEAGTPLAVMPAIASLMDSWIAKGYSNHDWAIIGKGRPISK